MEKLNVVVDSMARQGNNNIAITLMQENGSPLPAWEAGAHIDLFLNNKMCRQYSLTGSSKVQSHYTICVKKDISSRGGSKYIHDQLRVGDRFEISYPRNVFALQEAENYVFMAAGIGITPLLAMAHTLEEQETSFSLFYYVKTQADVAFAQHLSEGFEYGTCHILCDDAGGSILENFPTVLAQPNSKQHVYMCGPAGFMDYCETQLEARGWASECIFKEAFAPVQNVAQQTSTTDGFQVRLKSTGQTFDVPAHKTIATVLIENEIAVPLSCEMGMCGACLTEVCSGEVDHQDTVQTDEEKQASQQYIALCCSRAKSDLIEINL